jgi:hypothetical protein
LKIPSAFSGLASIFALILSAGAYATKPGVGPPPPKLYGAVGKLGTQVTLKDARGHAVARLKPGWYTLTISDASASQRFRLFGPGIDRSTSRAFVGTAIWGINLHKGTYRYQTVGRTTASRRFSVG